MNEVKNSYTAMMSEYRLTLSTYCGRRVHLNRGSLRIVATSTEDIGKPKLKEIVFLWIKCRLGWQKLIDFDFNHFLSMLAYILK